MPAGPSGPPGGLAIVNRKKRKAATRSTTSKRSPAARARRSAERVTRPRTADSQPLGEGMGDRFALDRLAAPVRSMRAARKSGMRELGWAAFGEVVRVFAGRIALKYRPAVVVGIAKGGVFVGGAIAAVLGAEFYPVRIEKRRRDSTRIPEARAELPDLTGKKVLVVDDVASTGATLAKARALSRKAGAREVRTAVLVARPRGARPDFAAFQTDELILFGWDYQLDAGAEPVDPGEVGV